MEAQDEVDIQMWFHGIPIRWFTQMIIKSYLAVIESQTEMFFMNLQ